MTLFKTNDIDVVKSCQSFFNFSLLSDLRARCNKKLNVTYRTCDKIFVHYGYQFVYDCRILVVIQ